MSETVRVETHFSGSAEAPELENYRPISPLVIGACLAGLLSLLAVLHPVLWVVPAVAAVLSICAIVRVSAADSRYSGRGAAVASLCLAAFVGAYAPARMISREHELYRQARLKVDEWLSLLQQGRVQEALQFSLSEDERFQGPGSLANHYADVPPPPRTLDPSDLPSSGPLPVMQLKGFVAQPGIARLLEFGGQARLEHLQNVSAKAELGNLVLTLRYRASGVRNGQPESMEFLIRATRNEQKQFASWYVGNLELLK